MERIEGGSNKYGKRIVMQGGLCFSYGVPVVLGCLFIELFNACHFNYF
jgi:hypothetical protein